MDHGGVRMPRRGRGAVQGPDLLPAILAEVVTVEVIHTRRAVESGKDIKAPLVHTAAVPIPRAWGHPNAVDLPPPPPLEAELVEVIDPVLSIISAKDVELFVRRRRDVQ